MFPVLLLIIFSLAALTASIASGRAKPGSSDSLLLQRENCVGYLLASIGLAVAAGNRFLAFRHAYELANNHLLGLDYFGIDLGQPLPYLYGILAFGRRVTSCGEKKTRKLESARAWKKIASEMAVLMIFTEIVTFACCVWPSSWQYYSLYYHGHIVEEERFNRITGENQTKIGSHWRPVRDSIDAIFPEPPSAPSAVR